jgi:uncharacterized RDD family membrane protein YckC
VSTGDYTTLVPVTGEAVAPDLRIAQFPSRTLALALDLAVQVAALLVLVALSGPVSGLVDGAAAAAIALVTTVAILVGLPTLVETLTRGRSLGKMAAGLRVVRDDGGPVRFRHSFVRALFMLVDFWLSSGAVGLISSLTSRHAKRLGDHFAGTVVIRERVVATGPSPASLWIPPTLEPWSATLDLSRLPDATALQARTLLTRAEALAPAARSDLARRLAAEVAAYLTPPPPAGLDPETYLRTVLTERMRRASARTAVRPAAPATAQPRVAPLAPPAAIPPGPVAPDTGPAQGSGFVAPS